MVALEKLHENLVFEVQIHFALTDKWKNEAPRETEYKPKLYCGLNTGPMESRSDLGKWEIAQD